VDSPTGRMIHSDSLGFAGGLGMGLDASLSLMTVDSIPVSELGQRDTGFLASTRLRLTTAYAAIASPSKFALFAFMFSESFLREFLILGMHLWFCNPRRSQVAPIPNYNIKIGAQELGLVFYSIMA
jgi:hypothetical protein